MLRVLYLSEKCRPLGLAVRRVGLGLVYPTFCLEKHSQIHPKSASRSSQLPAWWCCVQISTQSGPRSQLRRPRSYLEARRAACAGLIE